MTNENIDLETLASEVKQHLGLSSNDSSLQKMLVKLGFDSHQEFKNDESTIYLENKAKGFCLLLKDRSVLKSEKVKSIAPGEPVLNGAFFYSGSFEDYSTYKGKMPMGITWQDNPETLVARLGQPLNEIKDKESGALYAQRWTDGDCFVTANYDGAGGYETVYIALK